VRHRAILAAALLIGVGIVLGTTVFRADIAQATGLAQSVTVANTRANPVPVAQQGAVLVQGRVNARPVAPGSPWRTTYGSINIGSGFEKLLAGPSSVPINVTSISASATPGKMGYLSLLAAGVPTSASDCSGAAVYEIVYALDAISAPVVITFPTPFQVVARSNEKLCLLATVGGTGGSNDGAMSVNASGFYGS
jgi:hypothetical protein